MSDTTSVRAGFELDEARLARWMTANVEDFAGPLSVEQFKGGQSNPTYKLATPGRDYVLRKKPAGPILKGAHAIEREARVMHAVGAAGVPAPRIHGLCEDESVLGTAFYVMDLVVGRIFWDAAVPGVSAEERALLYASMNETIARLHALDPQAVGLGDFGKPGSYFERQISRWSRQYRDDADAGRDANMDRLIEWLEAHIPADDAASIVHGDYRIDNMIFHPTEPRVIAVLDWELSTLGHPLADFANHAIMYHMPRHIVAGLAGTDPEPLGIPSEADYVAAYCARTGRDGIANYDFYIAFNFFRMAAIFHGIRGRYLRGNASSAQAAERAQMYPELAALGLRLSL